MVLSVVCDAGHSTEEYLGVLAEEIRESGSDFIPMVHLLPGPKVRS